MAKKAAEKKIPDRKLGEMLGISHTMVRKYRLRGMPSHSEPAALAWLAGHTGGRFAETGDLGSDEESGADVVAELEARERRHDAAAAAEALDLGEPDASLEGMSQAQLTMRLTAARIRLTNRDASIRSLQERQAQMDADLRDGKLLRVEEEFRKSSELATALRNRLLALPAEWALQLAAIPDPALVADFTRKRIKAALIEFCAAYGVTAESQ